jgi:hypothetical protein
METEKKQAVHKAAAHKTEAKKAVPTARVVAVHKAQAQAHPLANKV